ncbi:ionotropic receptor 40a-like isoform X2 [Tenebrio molitor]|uniref:ionotropic receptor 40a-like isoform X2 n=1 Tax=Tenebrio molitor TaxID=7067 RepID=UPI0036249FE7
MRLVFIIVCCCNYIATAKHYKFQANHYGLEDMRRENGGDLVTAAFDIVNGFLSEEICICFDNATSINFLQLLLGKFVQNNVAIILFNITTGDVQDKYFEYLDYQVKNHLAAYTVFFSTHKFYEHVLLEVHERDYIRRNIVYVFSWGRKPFSRYFVRNVLFVMKVYVITNPRNDTFRIFYNQAVPYKTHHLEMVNWWHHGVGLFNHPTLPSKYKNVFKDFKGKEFRVPVIHKPPWHFVKYVNDTIEVTGGRDDRILSLLSKKINFRYKYFDPPERIQGSSASENGTFKGVLGLIWKREADFFIGDVALSHERSNYVEFSFITLADSGAFITHAPSKLNEALALLRPFQWQVWPAIGVTFVVVGPVLYAIIALPNAWRPRFRVRSHARLLFDCTWFTTTVLLKQTGKEPSSSHKARFFIIILSISATYVINDMYSANLTSLLAKPGREKAINNLDQLEKAMATRGYDLFVERHSSSYSLFENGTGIYGRLWQMMNRRQSHFLLESVEDGVKLVKNSRNKAMIAGRETLFFDIQRFGASNFHLSEKLNTAYSAIALQLGCPYIEEFNKILMAIFEAGIITKMTENEYENLGRQKEVTSESENDLIGGNKKENRRAAKVSEDNEKLQPISLKMLQGTFYLLCMGNIFSGLILVAEILVYKHRKKYIRKKRKNRCVYLKKVKNCIVSRVTHCANSIRRAYRRAMNEAFIATLEYLE